MDDWRLTNQKEYLHKKRLLKVNICDHPDIDHEHCCFCWDKFGHSDEMLHIGYCTEDYYNWICEECYRDFYKLFEWIVKT